ncbi:MAG: acyP [Bacteriovoracaceae bacterium]|nr:acyP [Bacteriovoracaceae bacterium]
MAVKAKRIFFSGKVQGVGFRAKIFGFSLGFRVSGYVRNLADGRVELWIEGEEDQIEKFLHALTAYLLQNIEKTEHLDETPKGFKNFGIQKSEK